MALRVLSAGAAKGLVGDLREEFTARTGVTLGGWFSAVGAVRERFEAGEACDVLILAARQLDELGGRVRGATPIGAVHTAVAVPAGHPRPDVSTGAAFAAAVRAASAVFLPDPFKSTAGVHVRSVLERLGIAEEAAGKLRAFSNGETAMRTLAQEAPAGAIGATQVTEILYTPGIELVAPLPPDYGLSTVYAAAASAQAALPDAAAELLALLTGPHSAELRRRSGFA